MAIEFNGTLGAYIYVPVKLTFLPEILYSIALGVVLKGFRQLQMSTQSNFALVVTDSMSVWPNQSTEMLLISVDKSDGKN